MARSIDTIQAQIVANIVVAMAAIGITIDPTQWSRRNLINLIARVVATAIAAFEQLFDQYKADTEAVINQLAPQTSAWLQALVFRFQFNATDPQIVQLNTTTLTPYYPIVVPDFQIVKFCSVNNGGLGNVIVKAAKGATPTQLTGGSTGELAALQSYLNQIKVNGIVVTATSLASDKAYIDANIFYTAQYSAVIEANVIAAITNYLATIPFDGRVQLTNLEIAIKAVAGVNDVVLNTVRCRQNTTAYPAGVVLVLSNLEIQRNYQTVAGYIEPETASGGTLLDTLTFIPE
jgi:hypothetical protein